MKSASDLNLHKKGLLAIQLAVFTTASMVATHTLASGCDFCLEPYVGVDAQKRYMHFEKKFGGNILKNKYPQGNIFAGLKFNKYLGIEAGYEFSKKLHSTKTLQPGDNVFGILVPTTEPSPFFIRDTRQSRASSKISGFNINLVGFLPIFCIEYNTQLLGSIGFANLKSRTRNAITRTEVDQTFFDPITGDLIDGVETIITTRNTFFTKRNTILKFSGGIQHMITDCIGIRALIAKENTSKIKAFGKDTNSQQVIPEAIAKLKNSFNYSLGIFTSF